MQIDKAAERNGAIANLVPAGLGGFADAKLTANQLEINSAEAGRRLVALLRNRPIEASHLSMFAIWAAERDDPRAALALASAAKRGWRDRYVQLTVLASAMDQGRIDVATARLDALARLKVDQEAIDLAISSLIRSKKGRKSFAVRMQESEYLRTRFTSYVSRTRPVGSEIVETLALAAKLDPEMDCELHGTVATAALKSGRPQYLPQVWPARCASKIPQGLAFDATFKNTKGLWPFSWQAIRQAGTTITTGVEDGTVTLSNRDPLRRPFARRFDAAEPGRYILRISDKKVPASASGFRKATVVIDVHCISPREDGGPRIEHFEGEGDFLLNVPPACPVQAMVASVTRGKVENVRIELVPKGHAMMAPLVSGYEDRTVAK
ncbi:hypothetical protein K3181_01085 [Qipengyuania sp. YG27]|uniref:Uncharacterized protein n=1 Tax=Qipengyuania mesophila TaxID=2867246 RepID=A0ABS7JQW1_9SPHN|nr:hypothetical protein [Qipengyuania mesophila]MBX7500033.1 hypothetical protein [Qipengyuania mesophila]